MDEQTNEAEIINVNFAPEKIRFLGNNVAKAAFASESALIVGGMLAAVFIDLRFITLAVAGVSGMTFQAGDYVGRKAYETWSQTNLQQPGQ